MPPRLTAQDFDQELLILDSAKFSPPCSRSHSFPFRGRVMAVVFGHDFRQVRSQSGNRYKYREGRSQRIGDN